MDGSVITVCGSSGVDSASGCGCCALFSKLSVLLTSATSIFCFGSAYLLAVIQILSGIGRSLPAVIVSVDWNDPAAFRGGYRSAAIGCLVLMIPSSNQVTSSRETSNQSVVLGPPSFDCLWLHRRHFYLVWFFNAIQGQIPSFKASLIEDFYRLFQYFIKSCKIW